MTPQPVGRIRFMDRQRVNLDGFAVENPELGRERPLGAKPLPRAQPAAADLLGQRAPDLLGGPRRGNSR